MITWAAIRTAIETALKANHGTNFDLSGDGRVLSGRYSQPPGGRLPFACVASPSVESVQGPVLRSWERRCVVDVLAWAACTKADTVTRVVESENFASLLMKALEVAFTTPGNTLGKLREFRVRSVVLDADLDPVPPGGLAILLVVEFAYHRDATGLG